MKYSRHPAKPLYQNKLNLDETIVLNEGSEEEDYHMITENGTLLGYLHLFTQFSRNFSISELAALKQPFSRSVSEQLSFLFIIFIITGLLSVVHNSSSCDVFQV